MLAACGTTDTPIAEEEAPLETAAVTFPPALSLSDVPSVPGLDAYVKDANAAVVLGKALFWDQATGSDGLACASCHYHAGADSRVKNQLDPGLAGGDKTFQRTFTNGKGGPNYVLKAGDFPFHRFVDKNDRASGLAFDTNDIVSSQGVYQGVFGDSPADNFNDTCQRDPDPVFHVRNISARKVEPRNTPTTINSVFYFRNFWDGRANNVYNGVDPFGLRNGQARVLKSDGAGNVTPQQVDLRNASLASQGDGPAMSDIEMICSGRAFAAFGRKMIPRKALAVQTVHADDSVLSAYRDNAIGKGLTLSYEELIKQAFVDDYWNVEGAAEDGFTQMENNFSLFWGLALQLYQATLVSNEAPYDRWAAGSSGSLSATQLKGLDVFMNKGKCVNCHNGPEFSSAASALQKENEEGGLVERMFMSDGDAALYDQGFYNIGVTPTAADLGAGEKDPWGDPLSFTRQYTSGRFVDPITVKPCSFEAPFDAADCSAEPSDLSGERTAIDGSFKTPSLRNVELTGPYFHDGSSATLEQVVDHYNRGGNFQNPELAPDITSLGLTSQEKRHLVAFMRTLTDPRVRNEQAPFDHPQLFIPNGHPGNQNGTQGGEFGQANVAVAEWLEVPAIGANGRSASGFNSLKDFAWTLRQGTPDLRVVRPFDPANRDPILVALQDRANKVGDTASGFVSARDPDAGNRVYYSASGLPTGVKMNVQGRFTGRTREAGEYLVTVIAYDGQLGSAASTFTWTVTN